MQFFGNAQNYFIAGISVFSLDYYSSLLTYVLFYTNYDINM